MLIPSSLSVHSSTVFPNHTPPCVHFFEVDTLKFQIILSSIWKVPMLRICFSTFVSLCMMVNHEQIYTLSMTLTSFEWASDAMFTRHECKICLQWLVAAWARIVLLFQRSHCEIYPRLWFLLHYCAIARCIRCTLCDSHCKMYSACPACTHCSVHIRLPDIYRWAKNYHP